MFNLGAATGILGVLLLLISAALGGNTRSLDSPLAFRPTLTPKQRQLITSAVRFRGELPEDQALHSLALEWARSEGRDGWRSLRREPIRSLALILILSFFYLIGPGAYIAVFTVQVLALLLSVANFSSRADGIQRARLLAERIDGAEAGPQASAESPSLHIETQQAVLQVAPSAQRRPESPGGSGLMVRPTKAVWRTIVSLVLSLNVVAAGIVTCVNVDEFGGEWWIGAVFAAVGALFAWGEVLVLRNRYRSILK